MSYFTSSEHAAVIANPAAIGAIYTANRTRFLASLGPNFGAEIEENFKLAFCAMFAYDLKPYGACTVIDVPGMLASPVLDCDNYAALAWRLFLLMVPSPTIKVSAVGWNGGHIGNHCQLFTTKTADQYGNGGGNWMIDPTVAVFQCGYPFDYIASGKPCATAYRANLYIPNANTSYLHGQVLTGLSQGKYKPSDLLYCTSDIEKFCYPPAQADWMTPQA